MAAAEAEWMALECRANPQLTLPQVMTTAAARVRHPPPCQFRIPAHRRRRVSSSVEVTVEGEQWRDTRYAGLQVSNHGRVRSRRGHNGLPLPEGEWRECRLSSQTRGYLVVSVGNRRTELVHRLVLEAFVGECPPGQQCRHLDGSKTNNRLDNLCWGTPAEDALDRVGHGTVTGQVITENTAREIKRRLRDRTGPLAEVAAEFGVSYKIVQNIHAGHTWKWLEA